MPVIVITECTLSLTKHTHNVHLTHIHLHKHTRILTKVGYPRDTYGLTLICKLNFIMKVGFLPPKPDSFFFFAF